MTQASLFYDSILDACRDTIFAIGGYKTIGKLLRPELMADAAGRWLADCVNPGKDTRLNPEQLLLLARLGREKGSHILATYFNRQAGYADPVPVEPEDERAALQRQFIEAQKSMQVMLDRMSRLAA